MCRKRLSTLFIILICCGACSSFERKSDESLTDYVDVFIGTGGKGKTYPGASLPFGMVQLSPDNGRNGWDWISGYFYPDSIISGFSHLHLSGTGAGDLYDISFFPYSGKPIARQLDGINPQKTISSSFRHKTEKASPGYYSVLLDDYNIQVELTATERTGLQSYDFNENQEGLVRLDLGYARNWDRVKEAYLEVVNDSCVVGYRKSTGWAKDQRVYFYSVFSKRFDGFEVYQNKEKTEGIAKAADVSGVFRFENPAGEPLMVKTGISSVSIENAKKNLEAEQSGFDFAHVKQQAQNKWNHQLSKIKIEAAPDNKVQFYTAMYHSMLAPTIFSDVDGRYKGADGEIHKAEGFTRYSTFSLWDTFRAWHPLATILHPDRCTDFLRSMMAHYQEYGLLPVWSMLGNETNMMMGYHSVPVIVDAIFKGLSDLDEEGVYEAMKKSAMNDDFGLKSYRDLGYVPYEEKSWNVSLGLEYAYDDWCIARLAKRLGKEEDYDYFMRRSNQFRNHFDPKTRFMRAMDRNGAFREPFNPLAYKPEDYCEANAWQYLWYVPQNVDALIGLMGGSEAFETKLDSMFSVDQHKGDEQVWISGYIGQYVHGNEPSHHVPYLYQHLAKSDKTEYWVRRIMDELYQTSPDGLCGNEDCGQMSAWYIFSALGFYPVNPASGEYVLGSPEVDHALVSLPGGRVLNIKAINQSTKNVYVDSVVRAGVSLSKGKISHEDILKGGDLIYYMRSK